MWGEACAGAKRAVWWRDAHARGVTRTRNTERRLLAGVCASEQASRREERRWRGDREERGMLQGTYAMRTMRRTGQAVGMSHHTCHTQQTHTQHTKTLVPAGTT